MDGSRPTRRRLWRALLALALAAWALLAAPAQAATCQAAGARGAAPDAWQTYCWLDLTSYNDATARSVGGQAFTIDLSDGSKIAFTLRTASTAATGATAQPAPSWTGAAIGNSSFLNIPGRPILYMSNTGSTVTFTISNIRVIPPPGVATITNYAFVVADAESTDNAETIALTTDGQPWAILDAVPPRTGNQYPTLAGAGTRSLTMSGGGQTGSVGSYIAASNAPKQVTAAMTGQGLQGLMFAVRFASIRLTKVIGATRIAAADQFAFEIASTSSGEVLAAGTTTGTGNGPFEAAVLSTASGVPLTLRERMAAGSASALVGLSRLALLRQRHARFAHTGAHRPGDELLRLRRPRLRRPDQLHLHQHGLCPGVGGQAAGGGGAGVRRRPVHRAADAGSHGRGPGDERGHGGDRDRRRGAGDGRDAGPGAQRGRGGGRHDGAGPLRRHAGLHQRLGGVPHGAADRAGPGVHPGAGRPDQLHADQHALAGHRHPADREDVARAGGRG